MELKTKVIAEDGKQEMLITREFNLPLDLLFRAYAEPEIVEQWMGSKVLKLDNVKHGGYQLEKKDDTGKVVFRANGAFHEFTPNKRITRTFEMENTPVGVQLEFYEFEPLTEDTSKLTMRVIYESVAQRDQVLQYGMRPGINAAHNRIEEVAKQLK
jgi:uncharacterized protein YndB with AHSA1/START domain